MSSPEFLSLQFHFNPPLGGDPGERVLYTMHPPHLCEIRALIALSLRFPRVTVRDISQEDHEPSCSICQTSYQSPYPSIPANAQDNPTQDTAEQPVETACGHVFGHRCLSTWLPKNTCPMCRTPLFKDLQHRHGRVTIGKSDARLLRDLEAAFEFADALREETRASGNQTTSQRASVTGPGLGEASIRSGIEASAHPRGIASPNRVWLKVELRRVRDRIDFLLYQQLIAGGVELPEPETRDPVAAQRLSWRQEQALFKYLQGQGAFRYPHLQRVFNRGQEWALDDEEILDRLRDLDIYWQPYGAWKNSDGSLIFLSAGLWGQLGRWRRENGRGARPVFLRDLLLDIDDAYDGVVSAELWGQLERWRENGQGAQPVFPRDPLLGVDDAYDDVVNDGRDDAEVFEEEPANEEEELVPRPDNTRRLSLKGLMRRAFGFVASRRHLRRGDRALK